MDLSILLDQAGQQLPWMQQLLEDLVRHESPTEDKALVDRLGTLITTTALTLGFRAKLYKQQDFGDILELSIGPSPERLLVLGHLDTVWPRGTLSTMPWLVKNGCWHGPGVLDMKAGIVMALAAAKLLKECGLHPSFKLLLNTEEEVGSPVSRGITETLARAAGAVFVLEPAQGLAYKTSRKGVGHYVVAAKGFASHSGVDFESGQSAIRELARQVETISNFSDPGLKRTVNCGVIAGGTRANVVAEQAHCEVDVRVATTSDGVHLDTLLRNLKSTNPKVTLTITGCINRPPMERSPGTIMLFERAQGIAAGMGFELREAGTGGGSDGNFTSALGIPTLDGMGAVGAGAHAANEHVISEQLPPRTALLAAMIASAV